MSVSNIIVISLSPTLYYYRSLRLFGVDLDRNTASMTTQDDLLASWSSMAGTTYCLFLGAFGLTSEPAGLPWLSLLLLWWHDVENCESSYSCSLVMLLNFGRFDNNTMWATGLSR